MVNGNSISDGTLTVAELAQKWNLDIKTLQTRCARKGIKERGSNNVLTTEQIKLVTTSKERKGSSKPIQHFSKSKPKKQISFWKRLKKSLPNQLDIINMIEMVLIIIGLYQLYFISGVVLSVMVCLFLWKAQQIAKNPKLKKANNNSLKLISWICFASFFLHFITFWNATPAFNMPIGWENLKGCAHAFAAFLPATFVSVCSYYAVYTTQSISKEKGL